MNLKTLKKEKFNKEGIFFTPEVLAKYLKDELYRYSENKEIKEVFDITCGDGSLLRVFDDDVIKYGSELNIDFLEKCRNINNFKGEQCDVLKQEPFKNKLFKHQIFNYPFSIKDNNINTITFNNELFTIKSNKDAYFILSILNKMDNEGIAVGLVFPGIAYRQSEYNLRKAMVLSGYLREIELIEGDFVDTKINCLKFVFIKNSSNDFIIFRDKDKTVKVSIKEIEEQDFSLSFNSYFSEEDNLIEKPCSIPQHINMFIEQMKENIEYILNIIDMDYLVGDSSLSEHKNNKLLFYKKLNDLIDEINKNEKI